MACLHQCSYHRPWLGVPQFGNRCTAGSENIWRDWGWRRRRRWGLKWLTWIIQLEQEMALVKAAGSRRARAWWITRRTDVSCGDGGFENDHEKTKFEDVSIWGHVREEAFFEVVREGSLDHRSHAGGMQSSRPYRGGRGWVQINNTKLWGAKLMSNI